MTLRHYLMSRKALAWMSVVAAVALLLLALPRHKENQLLAATCPNPPGVATLNYWPVTYSDSPDVCQDYPAIDAALKGGKFSQSQADWNNGLIAHEGDEVYVLSYIHNGAANNMGDITTARNVTYSATIPTTVGTDHIISASFRGLNTNTVNGSYAIHTDPGMTLQAVQGSGQMFNYTGEQVLRSGFDVTHGDYAIGDLKACFEYSVFIQFKVKVVKAPAPQNPTVSVVVNNQNNNQNTLQNINQNGNGNSAGATGTQGNNQQSSVGTGTGSSTGQVCTQVITRAYNPATGEVRDFPTPCAVPSGWIILISGSNNNGNTGSGSGSSTSTTTTTTGNGGTTVTTNNQNNNQNSLGNINQNGNGNSASISTNQSSTQTFTSGNGTATATAVTTNSQNNNQNSLSNINQNGSNNTTTTSKGSIVLSKKAWNDTRNADATKVTADREDQITYTLTVTNETYAAATNYVITDDLSGVLPFADVVDAGGGTLTGNTLSYPAVTVPSGGSVSKTFKVRVKYFLQPNLSYVMRNTFGNTVVVNIGNKPGVPTYVAPKTGSNATSAGVFAGLVTLGFVAFRNRRGIMNMIFA